jgi:hypothetical protein
MTSRVSIDDIRPTACEAASVLVRAVVADFLILPTTLLRLTGP